MSWPAGRTRVPSLQRQTGVSLLRRQSVLVVVDEVEVVVVTVVVAVVVVTVVVEVVLVVEVVVVVAPSTGHASGAGALRAKNFVPSSRLITPPKRLQKRIPPTSTITPTAPCGMPLRG